MFNKKINAYHERWKQNPAVDWDKLFWRRKIDSKQ